MIKNFLFRLTHKFEVAKVNGKYVILIRKWYKREWSQIVPSRYLSKTNALHDLNEIKRRGFV